MTTKARHFARWLHQLLTLISLLVIPLLVYWRMDMVDAKIGRKFGLEGSFDLAVVNADGYMLVLIFLLLLITWQSVRRKWHLLPRILILILLLMYVADLVLLKQFGTRILFSSVQLYIQYTALVWEQTREFLGGPLPATISITAAVGYAAIVLFPPAPTWLATRITCAAFLAAALIAAFMPWKLNYVKSWIVESYLTANLFVPEARTYSKAFIKEEFISKAFIKETFISKEFINELIPNDAFTNDALPTPAPVAQCERDANQNRNVIILVVESLSSYQSQLFGGTENWTPDLDALGSEALIYPRMHANGFSTNEGMVGILGGVRLMSPFSHMLFRAVTPFQTAWGIEETLPRLFSTAGYHTAFVTTGPLSFAGIGAWLEEISFEEIEGGDAAFYSDWPRVQFGAATDEALYARTLDWIAAREPEQPWMLTLATVSTHQPFLDPQTRQPDIEAVFRYADKHAALFIKSLQNSGYFENGILLLLGDHRSMTPLSSVEESLFGSAAPARVPMMLFGDESTGVHNGSFQQSDILPSFRAWLGDEQCKTQSSANLFDTRSPGRCALHVRGAKQSLVEVFCPNSYGQVELNGDKTRFVSHLNMPIAEQERILGVIARQRLAGEERHVEHLAKLKLNSANDDE